LDWARLWTLALGYLLAHTSGILLVQEEQRLVAGASNGFVESCYHLLSFSAT
jgi:hypothetical protein